MEEQIKTKMNDVLNYILNKPIVDVTFEEYKILKNRLDEIKYEHEKEERDKKMVELVANTFGGVSLPSSLE